MPKEILACVGTCESDRTAFIDRPEVISSLIAILEANTGLIPYRFSVTLCGGVSLTSANQPSSDGIQTKIPYQLGI